jgi:leucyl-tRNA synthetase
MVCKETTRCPEHGYLFPEEVTEGRCTHCGAGVIVGKTEKMSKSLKNVVDPDYLIRQYGADTARMFCLFAAPPEKDLEWSDQGVEGSFRFIGRTWRIVMDYLDDLQGIAPFSGGEELEGDLRSLRRKTHQTIQKVREDMGERFHFNTAISAIMELVNTLYSTPRPSREDRKALAVVRETIEAIVVLLAPIVPHLTEELWQMLGHQGVCLADTPLPVYDPAVAARDEMTIVIQVNGKVRGRIAVAPDEREDRIQALAMADEKVSRFIEGKTVIKQVYVPKKLLNIVVKG